MSESIIQAQATNVLSVGVRPTAAGSELRSVLAVGRLRARLGRLAVAIGLSVARAAAGRGLLAVARSVCLCAGLLSWP